MRVRKKDRTWNCCVDYHRLNEVTLKDAYPLPRMDNSMDVLSGSKFFSTLDLLSRYWQLALDDDLLEKAACVTRNGLWR